MPYESHYRLSKVLSCPQQRNASTAAVVSHHNVVAFSSGTDCIMSKNILEITSNMIFSSAFIACCGNMLQTCYSLHAKKLLFCRSLVFAIGMP